MTRCPLSPASCLPLPLALPLLPCASLPPLPTTLAPSALGTSQGDGFPPAAKRRAVPGAREGMGARAGGDRAVAQLP